MPSEASGTDTGGGLRREEHGRVASAMRKNRGQREGQAGVECQGDNQDARAVITDAMEITADVSEA